jgi:hypothetical protein
MIDEGQDKLLAKQTKPTNHTPKAMQGKEGNMAFVQQGRTTDQINQRFPLPLP